MTELEEQTHPEILRSNLSNTVLELAKLGVKASGNDLMACSSITYTYTCRI